MPQSIAGDSFVRTESASSSLTWDLVPEGSTVFITRLNDQVATFFVTQPDEVVGRTGVISASFFDEEARYFEQRPFVLPDEVCPIIDSVFSRLWAEKLPMGRSKLVISTIAQGLASIIGFSLVEQSRILKFLAGNVSARILRICSTNPEKDTFHLRINPGSNKFEFRLILPVPNPESVNYRPQDFVLASGDIYLMNGDM